MLIDEVYQLVNYIANKEGRGYIPPAKFNLCARQSQLEFLSVRIGNLKALSRSGHAPFGYKSNRRVDVDLRPFVYGPITIPIDNQGNFVYPYGYIWPDAIHKSDFREIKDIDSDEYPRIKHSSLLAPNADYPIVIFRNPMGFIDPYSIGSFQMSYVKEPVNPVWAYTEMNGEPVFNAGASVDFIISRINFLEITALILEKVGVNLDKTELINYSQLKQNQGS
jgi:hypothetical protein